MAVDAEVAGKGNATSRHEPDVEQVDERDLDEGTASDLAGRLEIRDNPCREAMTRSWMEPW
jgi:hypothetical protein